MRPNTAAPHYAHHLGRWNVGLYARFPQQTSALAHSVMALDFVFGPKSHPSAIDNLRTQLSAQPWAGSVYIGFPLLKVGGAFRAVDLLVTCREHGVVLFDLFDENVSAPPTDLREHQERLRTGLIEVLARSGRFLVQGKPLASPRIITVAVGEDASVVPEDPRLHELRPQRVPFQATRGAGRQSAAPLIASLNTALLLLSEGEPIDKATLRVLNASVQAIGNVRPTKASPSLGPLAGPRAATLAEMDKEVRNLDRWQQMAAIELPVGPQRIRGLAGSGKTIVLAFKAALMHMRDPQRRIVLTFSTRTMYEPVTHLVTQFHREIAGREPDWSHLLIRHSWGSKSREGVYWEVARHLGIPAHSIASARAAFGTADISGPCGELLQKMRSGPTHPLYDAVLIDEAQDLPREFLEMVHRVTSPPGQVIFAYDELQNLSSHELPPVNLLFGSDGGVPRVPELVRVEGEQNTDVILRVCYRNTPWCLTVAHALGLGVYRKPIPPRVTGLIQFYIDPELWEDIGYVVVGGVLQPGEEVILERDPARTPEHVTRLLTPDDAVVWQAFQTQEEEAEWVANEIERNINEDGLTPRDILIVSANRYFPPHSIRPLLQSLMRRNISPRVVAQDGSPDEFFGTTDQVSIAGVRRAKGNEAPMVYVVSAEHGASSSLTDRNALFTAITRSKAWVRISGVGSGMGAIATEIEQVVANQYRLRLKVPKQDELAQMHRLQRDMTRRVRSLVRKGKSGLSAFADLARGDMTLVDTMLGELNDEDQEALRWLVERMKRDRH